MISSLAVLAHSYARRHMRTCLTVIFEGEAPDVIEKVTCVAVASPLRVRHYTVP